MYNVRKPIKLVKPAYYLRFRGMKYDVHYTGQKLISIIIPLISITMAGEWRSRRNSLLQIVVAVYEMSDICSVVEGESHNTTRSTTIIDTNIHLKIIELINKPLLPLLTRDLLRRKTFSYPNFDFILPVTNKVESARLVWSVTVWPQSSSAITAVLDIFFNCESNSRISRQ